MKNKTQDFCKNLFFFVVLYLIQLGILRAQPQPPAVDWHLTHKSTMTAPTLFSSYSTNGENWFYDVCSTSDGGYVGCGYIDFFQPATPFAHVKKGCIVKVDADGNVLWEKYYDTGTLSNEFLYQTWFYSIIETVDHEYVAVGSEATTTNPNGANSLFVVKVNSIDGSLIKRATFGLNNVIGNSALPSTIAATGHNAIGDDVKEVIDPNTGANDGFVVTGLAFYNDPSMMIVRLNSNLLLYNSIGFGNQGPGNGYSFFDEIWSAGHRIEVLHDASGVQTGFLCGGQTGYSDGTSHIYVVATDMDGKVGGTGTWEKRF